MPRGLRTMLAVESSCVGAEFGAELHPVGCLLQLEGHVPEEEERSGGGDSEQLREVIGGGVLEMEA